MRRIIVAITGATGSIYGISLLRALRSIPHIQSHLIVSSAGSICISSELGMPRPEVLSLADTHYSDQDIGAAIASGSFRTDAMIIAPCSMNSLACIATGVSGTLIARSAEVILKERRRLILLTRETPLSLVHLRNMTTVSEMGGIIFPPLPTFYSNPSSIDDMVSHTLGHVLNLCEIENDLFPAWSGLKKSPAK